MGDVVLHGHGCNRVSISVRIKEFIHLPQNLPTIWTYLFCLVAGGILIAFSIAGDADSDVSGDGEGAANGGHASLIFSTSFWSFSLAGFGLCGVLRGD